MTATVRPTRLELQMHLTPRIAGDAAGLAPGGAVGVAEIGATTALAAGACGHDPLG